MRRLVYHVAATVDNFIARTDGSIRGFLPDGEHIPHYLEQLKSYDTVVMGRATYEFGYQFGMKPGDKPYPHMEHYIFSGSLKFDEPTDPGIHVVADDPEITVKMLKQKPGSDIYLCGGAKLAGYLLAKALIDRLIIKLNPVLFGEGIPLFNIKEKVTELELKDARTYKSGVVLLTYDIKY